MALLPQGQREQSLFFGGFVAIVGAVAYWYFLFEPKRVELATTEARLEQLEDLNARAQREASPARVRELRAEYEQYQKNLEVVRTLVPVSNEVPALLEQISTAARRQGLEIAAVDPQPVVEGEQFATYRYNIGVVGPYHSVGQFLSSIGSLTRIVAPVNMRLVPPSNPNSQAVRRGGASVEARFQIQTFVARTSAPDDPDARGTTGGPGGGQ